MKRYRRSVAPKCQSRVTCSPCTTSISGVTPTSRQRADTRRRAAGHPTNRSVGAVAGPFEWQHIINLIARREDSWNPCCWTPPALGARPRPSRAITAAVRHAIRASTTRRPTDGRGDRRRHSHNHRASRGPPTSSADRAALARRPSDQRSTRPPRERPGSISRCGPRPSWERREAPRGGDGPLGVGAARRLASRSAGSSRSGRCSA